MKNKCYNYGYVNRFVSLEDKIDFYYAWIGKNITTFTVDKIKSFVDKMVLWYEFRYSNKYFDLEDVDQVMLSGVENRYYNKLEWCNLFNYESFIICCLIKKSH